MEKYYWTMLPDSLAGKEAAHFVDFHPRLFSAIDFAYGNKLTLVKGDQKTSMRHKHEYLPGEYEIIVDA
ncbi:MAG: hypothetical protein KAS32_00625, partial [Candidatus Peribacteraceae bacterium]|nr:hypothetical protein [Candidatus Peribacteraceae bacterium]